MALDNSPENEHIRVQCSENSKGHYLGSKSIYQVNLSSSKRMEKSHFLTRKISNNIAFLVLFLLKPGGPHAQGAAAKKSYPMSEVRDSGRECQAATAQESVN